MGVWTWIGRGSRCGESLHAISVGYSSSCNPHQTSSDTAHLEGNFAEVSPNPVLNESKHRESSGFTHSLWVRVCADRKETGFPSTSQCTVSVLRHAHAELQDRTMGHQWVFAFPLVPPHPRSPITNKKTPWQDETGTTKEKGFKFQYLQQHLFLLFEKGHIFSFLHLGLGYVGRSVQFLGSKSCSSWSYCEPWASRWEFLWLPSLYHKIPPISTPASSSYGY